MKAAKNVRSVQDGGDKDAAAAAPQYLMSATGNPHLTRPTPFLLQEFDNAAFYPVPADALQTCTLAALHSSLS